MDRQVAKVGVRATIRTLGNKARCQCAIPACPRDIIDAVAGEKEFAGEKSRPPAGLGNTGGYYGSVLIAITGKEVGEKLAEHRLVDSQGQRLIHSDFIQ